MRKSPMGLAASLLVFACGQPPSNQAPPPTHELHAGAPTESAVPDSTRVTLPAPVQRMGATLDGRIVAHAGGKTYEISGSAAEERPLYVAPGDPEAVGAVHAITARRAGGAWLATDRGLFLLDGLYVAKSSLVPPASATPSSPAVYSVVDAAPGELGGLWFAADAGLFRWRADAFERLSVPDHTGPVQAVAVDASSSAVAVRVAEAPALLVLDGEKLVSDGVPEELGSPVAFAAVTDALLGVGERGLVRWKSGADPAWTRFPLHDDAEQAVAVRAVAVDPVSGVAWLRTSDRIVKLDGDELSSFVAPALATDAPASLAVDAWGDLWTHDGSDAVRFKVGVGSLEVAFAQDLAPWLAAHCTRCHADFADVNAFGARADAALSRVRSGDMPRCEGGVRCPTEQHLQPSEYAVLEAWIRGGRKP